MVQTVKVPHVVKMPLVICLMKTLAAVSLSRSLLNG